MVAQTDWCGEFREGPGVVQPDPNEVLAERAERIRQKYGSLSAFFEALEQRMLAEPTEINARAQRRKGANKTFLCCHPQFGSCNLEWGHKGRHNALAKLPPGVCKKGCKSAPCVCPELAEA